MPDRERPQQRGPAEIAREALRRLAAQRIPPTPDAYRDLYCEVAGTASFRTAQSALGELAASLQRSRGNLAELGKEIGDSVVKRDWDAASTLLEELAERYLSQPSPAGPEPTRHADERFTRSLRELLASVLSSSAGALAEIAPELIAESQSLVLVIKDDQSDKALTDIGPRLKQFCWQLELKSTQLAEQQKLQLSLLRLVLENVGELVEDGSWVKGQIGVVQRLISGPINSHTLEDATRSLKEAIQKQGKLKRSLTEAKVTLKNMMTTFIDQLGAVASSTDDYHDKLGGYAEQIHQAEDIAQLSRILGEVMHETRAVQTQTKRSRDEMIAARREVENAQVRIQALESQLEQMSDLVREDQLTGSLNRRGLEDVFSREAARADRSGAPLSVAMLDLDNFKALNDTHGHRAGDEALVHLVKVVKDTLRTTDVIARYGGEEFLILLPDTALDEASAVLIRLQRELTKRYFMQNNERLLITFSAGVALRAQGEEQSALFKRVDEAMYRAKKAGKNCVVAAR